MHPQLPGSKRYGCPFRPILEISKDQRREKCIRNCQGTRNADAQSDNCKKSQESRSVKSASAIARKQGMRMPIQTIARSLKRAETRKVHPQLPGNKRCGCPSTQLPECSGRTPDRQRSKEHDSFILQQTRRRPQHLPRHRQTPIGREKNEAVRPHFFCASVQGNVPRRPVLRRDHFRYRSEAAAAGRRYHKEPE